MRIALFTLLVLLSCAGYGQTLDALPTIDDPQPEDRIDTYTRGFAAAFRLDTLRRYFAADLVEGLVVDPYTSIPDSLRGRFFTSTSDSLYYVDYFGGFINLTPGTGGGGSGAWDDLTGIPDSIVYTSELAAAQQAAEDYADANDDVDDADADPSNELQTISKAGVTVTLSDGGGSFTDAVDDADASPTNEAQTISAAGSTSPTINLTTAGGAGGGTVTLVGAGATTFGRSGNTITATTTEVDGSTANELQTFGVKTGTNYTLSNGGGTIDVADNDNDPTNELYDDTAIQAQVDVLPTDADVAAAQAAAQAYADANDDTGPWEEVGSFAQMTGVNRYLKIGGTTGQNLVLIGDLGSGEIGRGYFYNNGSLVIKLDPSNFSSFTTPISIGSSSLPAGTMLNVNGLVKSTSYEITGTFPITMENGVFTFDRDNGVSTIRQIGTNPELSIEGPDFTWLYFTPSQIIAEQKLRLDQLGTGSAVKLLGLNSSDEVVEHDGSGIVDGNGIEDGGDVSVPLNTDVQGYSYSGSGAFDTRQQWGHVTGSNYTNGWYTAGTSGIGLKHEAVFNSSGSLVGTPYYQAYGSNFEYTRLVPRGITHNSNGRYFMLDFYGSKPRLFYDTGTEDYYQFGEDERPTEDAVLVTDDDGLTNWNPYTRQYTASVNSDQSFSSTSYTEVTDLQISGIAEGIYSVRIMTSWEETVSPAAGNVWQMAFNYTNMDTARSGYRARGTVVDALIDWGDDNPQFNDTPYADVQMSEESGIAVFTSTGTFNLKVKAASGETVQLQKGMHVILTKMD